MAAQLRIGRKKVQKDGSNCDNFIVTMNITKWHSNDVQENVMPCVLWHKHLLPERSVGLPCTSQAMDSRSYQW